MSRLKWVLRNALYVILECFAVLKAWIAYALYGSEGLNQTVRSLPKPQVIPVLRAFGARVGSECEIESPLLLHHALARYRNLVVGTGCHIGKEVFIDLAERVTIKNSVTISMRVTILTHIDVGRSPLRESELPSKRQPVTLETGVYVGAGAILLPGVRVGENAAIGAGSVVTKSVDSFTLVAGVPARVIRRFSSGTTVES